MLQILFLLVLCLTKLWLQIMFMLYVLYTQLLSVPDRKDVSGSKSKFLEFVMQGDTFKIVPDYKFFDFVLLVNYIKTYTFYYKTIHSLKGHYNFEAFVN